MPSFLKVVTEFVPKAKIVIGDSKDSSRRLLKELLTRSAYQVQAEARNSPDLLRKVRTFLPDLVIIDSNLEGGSVAEAAGIIEDDNLSNVLILTESLKSPSMENFVHIMKPYESETLLSVIKVCLMYNQRVFSMQQEVDKLKENLTNRKLLDKAKGIIMKNLGLDEENAYRMMQKESMNRGIAMKDLARAVIAVEEGKD